MSAVGRWAGGRLGRALANLGLVLASLAVSALAAELVVFRFVLLPSDVPENAYLGGVIKHAPGQSGTYRIGDEIEAPYRINAQGWNSGHASYRRARTRGKTRIAVIGDSYVEALQVPYDRSLAEVLERLIGPEQAEVYRFGISGAPLSQYLYMLEHEVLAYRPDQVVIVLVHNDFTESFLAEPGRYTQSFMRLRIEDGRVVGEVPPAPWRRGWLDAVRMTATMRYLYTRRQVNLPALKRGLLALARGAGGAEGGAGVVGGGPAARAGPAYEANIDLAEMEARFARVTVATDHVFARLKRVASEAGIGILLVMDAPRRAIYEGRIPDRAGTGPAGAFRLNALAARLARAHGLPLVDLTGRFAADWRANRARLDFRGDGHWNARAHRIAAEAVYEALFGAGAGAPGGAGRP